MQPYLPLAEKLQAYFQRHLSEGDERFKSGYELAVEWIRLLKQPHPDLREVKALADKVADPGEAQGTAFVEMRMFVNKWSREMAP